MKRYKTEYEILLDKKATLLRFRKNLVIVLLSLIVCCLSATLIGYSIQLEGENFKLKKQLSEYQSKPLCRKLVEGK